MSQAEPKHVGETISPDLQTTTLGAGQDRMDFHPKVKAYFKRMLSSAQQHLESCSPEQLAYNQAVVKVIRVVLGAPNELTEIERRRVAAGEPPIQLEDFKESR